MLIIYGYLLNDAKFIPCNECCYHYNLLGHSQSKDCIKVKHKSKGLFKAITIVKRGNILLRIQLYWNKSLGCFIKTEVWDHRPSLLLTGIVHTKVSQTFMTRGNFTAWSKTLAVRLQPSTETGRERHHLHYDFISKRCCQVLEKVISGLPNRQGALKKVYTSRGREKIPSVFKVNTIKKGRQRPTIRKKLVYSLVALKGTVG